MLPDLDLDGLSPPELLHHQRSHILLVLSNAPADRELAFLDWYRRAFRQTVVRYEQVLRLRNFRRHEVDITTGRHPLLPFEYLAICEMSLDGGEQAAELITAIAASHVAAGYDPPATWLFFPAGEIVGRSTPDAKLITVAFANGVEGMEEFREFYTTRHIRHAMKVPALVSGQCFERAQFQLPGAMETAFHVIALYEQVGSAESIIECFQTLPKGSLAFPAMDMTPRRFAESAYRLLD